MIFHSPEFPFCLFLWNFQDHFTREFMLMLKFMLMVFLCVAAAESLQSCPDSVRPHRWQPIRLPVPGILQARTLEWAAISFSNACKWKVKVKLLSRVRLLATPWTAAYQAPLSMGFSRQEYWSGLPLPSPGDSLWGCKRVTHNFATKQQQCK